MRRYATILLTMTGLIIGMAPVASGAAGVGREVATLKSVNLAVGPGSQELVLRVGGNYTYRSIQAAPDSLFIDLAGAKLGAVPRKGTWSNPLLTGYKVFEYQDASGQPMVRVQVNTVQASPFTSSKDGSSLRLTFGVAGSSLPEPAAMPASSPAAPVAATRTPAPSAQSASGPLRVSNVAINKGDAGETLVEVSTSRTATYHVSKLTAPPRLVVDIEGTRETVRQRYDAAESDLLRDVRVAQFRSDTPAVVRVVADLKGNPLFDVHATGGGIRIELRSPASSKPVVSALPAVTPATAGKPVAAPPAEKLVAAATPVAAPQTSAAAPRVQASEPAVPAVDTKEIAKPDVQSTLPPAAGSSQVAAPLPTPASQTPEVLRAEHAAHILTPVAAAAPQAAQSTPPGAANPGSEDKSRYTGEPISLNLKDVDLKDFFRLIHEISGLNIIVDPNVSGNVTLVLDAVPWDQALDIVLKNNRLGKVLEGNVLRIARIETLTAEQESVTKLAAARMDAAPLVTIFQPLNYAKAQTIQTLLKSWTGGGALTRRGTVLVDDRSNTLIISDVQSQIPVIQGIIAKIDKKAKQVMIEARVVLATADFTRQLQTALSGSSHNASTSTLIGGETGTSGTVSIPQYNNTTPTASTTSVTPNQQILPGTSTGFGSFVISNASSKYMINAIISASEERDQARTISRPTIVTQNNVMGMVQQGTQVPVQTTINNTITVNYVDATLRMDVTPQITDDGNIFMQIRVQNASVGALLVAAAPNINTQQATTQVLVPDGGTVVFGGITVTSRSKNATYIPWLGSIPVLGHLFKASNVQDNDLELLFFVSPKILIT